MDADGTAKLMGWGARVLYLGPAFALSPHRNATGVLAVALDRSIEFDGTTPSTAALPSTAKPLAPGIAKPHPPSITNPAKGSIGDFIASILSAILKRK